MPADRPRARWRVRSYGGRRLLVLACVLVFVTLPACSPSVSELPYPERLAAGRAAKDEMFRTSKTESPIPPGKHEEFLPLAYFPIARDLIIVLDDFMAKLRSIKPWIIRPVNEQQPLSEGEYLQTPAELAQHKQYSMCINCMLCYSACPVYGLDSNFVGPAALALAQRYNLDNRDEGEHERLTVLNQPHGIWGCTFVGECSRVCPKDVDPAGAIQRYKVTAAMATVKSLLMPWGQR